MASVQPNHMRNYPDDVWPGDPSAPWNADEAGSGRTCGDCVYMERFGDGDKRTITAACPDQWRRSSGAVVAINAIAEKCGFCTLLLYVVTCGEDADDCADWEQRQ